MSTLLYLVHRLPYPPNKGDKVRSYHLLRHLAREHDVCLGTFVDDPDDVRHVDTLRELCADVCALPLDPRAARLRSLAGLWQGEALTLPYYRDQAMHAWVRRVASERRPEAAVVFSSPMAQYLASVPGVRALVDFVDVDSAKWSQYGASRPWPLSWLYRREGERLLAFERRTAQGVAASFFVTEAEVRLFLDRAPECAGLVQAVGNGVDADYFSPQRAAPSPYAEGEVPLVFTGAMDYWPNIDAVAWFVAEVLPLLVRRQPKLRFYIVGMRPAAAVRALADERVIVTGTVPDVRPYLQHAALVVAPLRVARGVQNKILEAMAMGRAVVASRACANGIDAAPGRELETATEAAEYAERIDSLLADRARAEALGQAARQRVLATYSWAAQLSRIDAWIDAAAATTARAAHA